MKPLFWIDLEMTGLDEKTDKILEIAVVITDEELNSREEYHRVVFQPKEILDTMNDWCKKTHGESGLTAAVPNGLPIEQIDDELISLISRHFAVDDRIILCGNSVGNDQRFIQAFLPQFTKRMHYRVIDVSSFKEIFQRKWGMQYKKKNGHRAVDDIYESIAELKHYLSFFVIPEDLQKAKKK